MAIKFEKIKAGDELFQKSRRRMGNTTVTEDAIFIVKIISVDPVTRTAMVSWNSNREELWGSRQLERLYRKRPKTRPNPFDVARAK